MSKETVFMNKGLKNIYVCEKCGGSVVTVDLVEGVTPMTIMCRSKEGCKGFMYSSFYKVDQSLKPQFEWYKPTSFDHYPKGSQEAMKEHVNNGGLDLRSIEQTAEDEVRELLNIVPRSYRHG